MRWWLITYANGLHGIRLTAAVEADTHANAVQRFRTVVRWATEIECLIAKAGDEQKLANAVITLGRGFMIV
jgi:hypothetical protein